MEKVEHLPFCLTLHPFSFFFRPPKKGLFPRKRETVYSDLLYFEYEVLENHR